jgi:hypothetical protein
MSDQLPRDERGPGGDDMPPSGEEARAQRKATSMPWVWLILAIGLAALFAILLEARSPRQAPPMPGGIPPAPLSSRH